MKIKFNWGTGIILVIVLFFVSVFVRIYISYQHEVDLISQDYYPKGIDYQHEMEKKSNAELLNKKIKAYISTQEKLLVVEFPDVFKNKPITGTITLYRPSATNRDVVIPLVLDSLAKQRVNAENLIRGKYIIKADWKLGNIEYYQEVEVFIEN